MGGRINRGPRRINVLDIRAVFGGGGGGRGGGHPPKS